MAADYIVRRTTLEGVRLLYAHARDWAPAETIAWGPEPYLTRFRALCSPAALFVRFDAADESPWHTMTRRDDRLWEEEVVEIFLDPSRAGVDYAELEISPANVVCDLIVRRPWPKLSSDPSWDIEGLVTRVTPWREPESGPDGWTATARIPWVGLAPMTERVTMPPRPGDRWGFNVFRIKRPAGPEHPGERVVLAAWQPTGTPSFHVPSAFGSMVFEVE